MRTHGPHAGAGEAAPSAATGNQRPRSVVVLMTARRRLRTGDELTWRTSADPMARTTRRSARTRAPASPKRPAAAGPAPAGPAPAGPAPRSRVETTSPAETRGLPLRAAASRRRARQRHHAVGWLARLLGPRWSGRPRWSGWPGRWRPRRDARAGPRRGGEQPGAGRGDAQHGRRPDRPGHAGRDARAARHLHAGPAVPDRLARPRDRRGPQARASRPRATTCTTPPPPARSPTPSPSRRSGSTSRRPWPLPRGAPPASPAQSGSRRRCRAGSSSSSR